MSGTYTNEDWQHVRNSAPIPEQLANEMFDFVVAGCKKAGYDLGDPDCSCNCDGSLAFAREFICSYGLDEDRTIAWLESFGGYCDCRMLWCVGTWYLPPGEPNVNFGGEL